MIILHNLFHMIVILSFPPLLLGVINRTKAMFGGRRGQPILQTYFDLIKLMQKDCVFSETTSWVFRFGPIVSVVTALVAACIVPLGHASAPLSFTGDLILFAYVLALGRFFTMAAALDTGSAFEGMGAAREATFAVLAEPVLFLGLLVFARLSGSLQMSQMLGDGVANGWGVAAAPLLLIVASWFVVLLVENCRIPFDDPNTHLELTMIHEVMVLDHSGPTLGLIVYAAALKLFVFAGLIVNLILPFDSGSSLLDWLIFLLGTLFVAVVIGTIESTMARLKIAEIPKLLIGAGVVSLFAVILLLSYQ
ncbi:Formate hydrogenlyase subunit 4 [Novipirellula aureliae]|uniref:Formate hydrogenlyase subunit 4 n=1 Tax=Novipirellula aureliae TaxID=2527966 RepID=A0A5C6DFM8_9BACT|nr:NADH-quinone oxidoreductase subunit H [Novipirellula aureliae]TWU34541.1 Formate hydrogenlyase subunit 4 [Novipirellula aureliae]